MNMLRNPIPFICRASPGPLAHISRMALCLAVPLLAGCAHNSPAGGAMSFASPDEAATALANAARADDVPRLMSVMGSGADKVLASGDAAADRQRRQEFVALYDARHSLENDGDARRTLVVGADDWPFPVPIVREGSKWRFDTEAGVEEILNRRVGRNELFTIQVCKAIGDAQREYALRDPEKTGSNAYAMKFVSDDGRRNGLFWRTTDGDEPSPLGDLVAEAAAQGYTRKEVGPTPYHGYCFRILTSQGSHAPDGAVDYVVNGKMVLGFAVLAYPARYGNSGVMTFMMGPDGVVYQKDLGDDTATLAGAISSFDPGDGWTKSAEQDPTPAVAKASADDDDDDDDAQ